jgi:protein tyrosine phosphatase (PTP) superfamily phosphohydrolase (DUF442 family)
MMITEIYNYLQISDMIHSSGMPTHQQVLSLAKDGIQVVINLATSNSEGWMSDEREQVSAQHIDYYEIPVDWDNPTRDDLNKFAAIMDKHHNQVILVHCQANYRATGFIAIYRVNRLGWAEANAFRDLKKIWDPSEYPTWQNFIEKSLRAQS